METALKNSQVSSIQKVKNILIRHSCSKEVQKNSHYQHPETPYILKYSPKYYKNLTLETTSRTPLLSKVKKIKKLKEFTGLFRTHLPQKLWFNLLANNRKEIEEIPETSSLIRTIMPSESFRKRLEQQKIKFFPNMTRVFLSGRDHFWKEDDDNNLFSVKKLFAKYASKYASKYAWGLRKLKSLKISMCVKKENDDQFKWILEKLDKMNRFLSRLDIFILNIMANNVNMQDFCQKKNVLSHLTGLSLSGEFDPVFAEIPQRCKNLNYFSFHFPQGVGEKPEFLALLASLRDHSQLKGLEFIWPKDAKPFWYQFKPQPSLRHLKLAFDISDTDREDMRMRLDSLPKTLSVDPLPKVPKRRILVMRRVFKIKPDVVDHWEDINELDTLEFNISVESDESLGLMRDFITLILKKVRKVRSLKIQIRSQKYLRVDCELFSAEETPHLYESLEKFEQDLWLYSGERSGRFDLQKLKPFRNLKELKLEGDLVFSKNIEDMVELLEANQKEGEYPELTINVSEYSWRETLEKIEKVKRMDSNLKMRIDCQAESKDFIENLEKLLNDIQSVKPIKGLVICLDFFNSRYPAQASFEDFQEILKRHSQIRNLMVRTAAVHGNMFHLFKVDGQKEQLFNETI